MWSATHGGLKRLSRKETFATSITPLHRSAGAQRRQLSVLRKVRRRQLAHRPIRTAEHSIDEHCDSTSTNRGKKR